MSKMTRKLFLSVIAVVLTVFALGSTTFAWFTLTSTASVEAFEAEIVSDSGIEVALGYSGVDLDELEWKTTLTATDINDYIAAKYIDGFKFSPVTSLTGTGFTNLDGGNTGHLTVSLHFRSDDVTSIDWESISLTGETATFNSDVVFTNEHGVAQTTSSSFSVNAADAMRISMVGTVGGSQNVAVYENPALGTNVVLGGLTAEDLTPSNGSVSYYTAVTEYAPAGADSVSVVDTVTTLGTGINVVDLAVNADYGKTYGGELIINIWFEGWDANAYNTLLGLKVTTAFSFEDASID